MNWQDRQGMIADLNFRIEVKRLLDKAVERDDGTLAAILEVAINTLDQRLSDQDTYARGNGAGKQPVTMICRNIRVEGKRTSVKLEAEFWQALDDMAEEARCSVDDLCDTARRRYEASSLASAIRVFILSNSSMAEFNPPAFA